MHTWVVDECKLEHFQGTLIIFNQEYMETNLFGVVLESSLWVVPACDGDFSSSSIRDCLFCADEVTAICSSDGRPLLLLGVWKPNWMSLMVAPPRPRWATPRGTSSASSGNKRKHEEIFQHKIPMMAGSKGWEVAIVAIAKSTEVFYYHKKKQ